MRTAPDDSGLTDSQRMLPLFCARGRTLARGSVPPSLSTQEGRESSWGSRSRSARKKALTERIHSGDDLHLRLDSSSSASPLHFSEHAGYRAHLADGDDAVNTVPAAAPDAVFSRRTQGAGDQGSDFVCARGENGASEKEGAVRCTAHPWIVWIQSPIRSPPSEHIRSWFGALK